MYLIRNFGLYFKVSFMPLPPPQYICLYIDVLENKLMNIAFQNFQQSSFSVIPINGVYDDDETLFCDANRSEGVANPSLFLDVTSIHSHC